MQAQRVRSSEPRIRVSTLRGWKRQIWPDRRPADQERKPPSNRTSSPSRRNVFADVQDRSPQSCGKACGKPRPACARRYLLGRQHLVRCRTGPPAHVQFAVVRPAGMTLDAGPQPSRSKVPVQSCGGAPETAAQFDRRPNLGVSVNLSQRALDGRSGRQTRRRHEAAPPRPRVRDGRRQTVTRTPQRPVRPRC